MNQITGDAMADTGQTAVAWEMLSSVVVLRAKARESKLPKLLSSLHGVEVELARIIAGSETGNGQIAANGSSRGSRSPALPALNGQHLDALAEIQGLELESDMALKARPARRNGPARGDQQLRAHAKKYLALSRQLSELVNHGEAVASGALDGDPLGEDWDARSDPMLAEQHDLSSTIARLKASTFEGLVDKAAVLDDLVEENSDDPVQTLARSLARDVIAMGSKKPVR
ncbi:MAG: hypothetical protein KJZ80_07015 [Hyphomicrobiaceae bacterium]|nr:hypothetical protein [Hyphomicrobiaceae bacterium]